MASKLFKKIKSKKWDVFDTDEGLLVAEKYFKKEFNALDNSLSKFSIPVTDFIRSGENKAEPTKRLEKIILSFDWKKNVVTSETNVTFSDKSLLPLKSFATSHEIDHVGFNQKKDKKFALEIEWNNKDEFYDRDLSAMKGLYNIRAIELGVIILKGKDFGDKAVSEIEKYFRNKVKTHKDFDIVKNEISILGGSFTFPTDSQRNSIDENNVRLNDFPLAVSKVFCSSKYGSTTTTWDQLKKREDRGSTERIPLIFLGISPETIYS